MAARNKSRYLKREQKAAQARFIAVGDGRGFAADWVKPAAGESWVAVQIGAVTAGLTLDGAGMLRDLLDEAIGRAWAAGGVVDAHDPRTGHTLDGHVRVE